MIRVLVVDDSVTERMYMESIVRSDPELTVAGSASNGEEALEMVKALQPDIILMDIQMPKMDGFTATRRIMETYPTPIIIISSKISAGQMNRSFEALAAGAVYAIEKPAGPGHPDAAAMALKISQTIRLMSKIKFKAPLPSYPVSGSSGFSKPLRKISIPAKHTIDIVAMGASTGGPPVIQRILSNLAPEFPYTIVIVQHIATGFLKNMVHWLDKDCPFPVRIAKNHERVLPGTVYFAPDHFHMGIGSSMRIILSEGLPENGVKPSVSHLFRSLARFHGSRCAGILLTGMGRDGAMELKMMKDQGAITMVQDRETSAVYGMPGEALRLEGATHVLSPAAITVFLNALRLKGSLKGQIRAGALSGKTLTMQAGKELWKKT